MKIFFLSLTFLYLLTFKSYSTIIQNVEVKNNDRISKETIITYEHKNWKRLQSKRSQ